jgi:lactoylglutathione lyase
MKVKAVDFACYAVSDLKKSIDFYQKTLGLEMTFSGDKWAEFQVGNVALDIGEFGGFKGPSNGSGVAFAVDDIKKALGELKKKGVKVEDEVWESPVCHGGSFYDPDGNVIYLHHRKDGTVG